jgi:hypothetical protein
MLPETTPFPINLTHSTIRSLPIPNIIINNSIINGCQQNENNKPGKRYTKHLLSQMFNPPRFLLSTGRTLEIT